jgi:hypothetical protein
MDTSSIAGLVFALIGVLMYTIGSIWVLVLAFRRHIGWGLASLLIPFVLLVFGVMNWSETQEGMMLTFVGMVVTMFVSGLYFTALPM